MLINISIVYITSLYFVLIFHELIHVVTAKILNYDAKIKIINIIAFKVEYINKQRHWDNLLIAGVSPLVLFILGIVIPLNFYTLVLKIGCIINIFNLLPITGDGEVILLSLFKLFRGDNMK